MNHRGKTIFKLCIFGIILKVTLLIFAIDEFYDYEELARGLIAQEVLKGAAYPIFNYQSDNYSGGSLFMGILAVPFFAAFGNSIFVLKLPTVFFSLLTAIFIYLILSKYVDKQAASFAAMFVFLAPYSYTRLSLVVWGDHPQMPVLMAILFFMFYELTFGNRRRSLFVILFGLICGFGLYFCYHFLAPFTLCIIFLFAWDRKFFFSCDFIYFLLGFFIGFSPWIYFNMTHNFHGLIISEYGSILEIPHLLNLSVILKRLFHFVTYILGFSFTTNSNLNLAQKFISLLYYFIFLISFTILIVKNRATIRNFFCAFLREIDKKTRSNWQELPFIFYIPIFIFFVTITPYSLTNYPNYFPNRYLTTIHTCMFIIIAIAIMTLWRKRGLGKIIAAAMIGIILFNGISTNLGIILRGIHNCKSVTCLKKRITQRGFSYAFLKDERIAYAWYKGNLSENLNIITKSKDGTRRYYLSQALGRSIAYYARDKFSDVLELISRTTFSDELVKNSIYEGLGYGRGRWYSNYLKRDFTLLKEQEKQGWFNNFLQGLQESIFYWFKKDFTQTAKFIEESIPELYKENFFYQLGIAIVEKNKGVLSQCLDEVSQNISFNYLGKIYQGLGDEIKRRSLGGLIQKSKAIVLIQEKVPFEYQAFICTIFEK